jgi:hypothetical protein
MMEEGMIGDTQQELTLLEAPYLLGVEDRGEDDEEDWSGEPDHRAHRHWGMEPEPKARTSSLTRGGPNLRCLSSVGSSLHRANGLA